ncbi:hypothetical protein [Jeotgalibacillus proteolyticus]|uniref:hypothetical protein n=1 Tax=Jeotgalibacillus proteolyticus TaxID=2082395 RepID=UPI003CEDECC5
MKKKYIVYFILLLSLIGCSSNNSNQDQDTSEKETLILQNAYDFAQEQGWSDRIDGDYTQGEIAEVTATKDMELTNEEDIGKEVFTVTFKEKENVAVGIPIIIVNKSDNNVIGYLPSE